MGGYHITRKPPIPKEAFAGCKKPPRQMSVEEMYNRDIPRPPAKPPLPHDALRAVVKKPPPPKFDESATITDTQSYYRLTQNKALATEDALERLLGYWESVLTEALGFKLMEEQETHHQQVHVPCSTFVQLSDLYFVRRCVSC